MATFAVVLVAAGTAALEPPTGIGPVGIAVAYGSAVGTVVAALSPPALGNPAVAAAGWILGDRSAARTGVLVVAELLGAVLAALLLAVVLPRPLADTSSLGTPFPAPGLAPWRALLAEAAGSFLVVLVALRVRDGAPRALGVGAAIAAGALFAWPLSGAALNPARAFGPALVSGTWTAWWVAWAGPLAGAGVAAIAARALPPR